MFMILVHVLFTCRQSANKNQLAVPKSKTLSLLEKTCELIKNFPEYLDVVVSVARKTDGRHWADLFSATGRSIEYIFALLVFELCGGLDNFTAYLQSITNSGQKYPDS